MAEPGGTEIQQHPIKPRFIDRVVGALRGAVKTFEIDTKPVPVEQINPGRIARLLDEQVHNPFGKDRFRNGFNINTILGNMNYYATLQGEDLSTRYPEAYDKTQEALWELHQRGVLGVIRDPQAQERIIGYKVIDEPKLMEIVSRARSSR